MPGDKRRRCDLPLLQGGFNLEGGVKTSVNFLKITFQYLTLDIMHLGVVSRRTVLPARFAFALVFQKDFSENDRSASARGALVLDGAAGPVRARRVAHYGHAVFARFGGRGLCLV